MARTLTCRCLWCSALLLVGVGCSRSGPVPVKGTVKLDGKPLAGASVLFLTQDPTGRDARGATDADGGFRLTTHRPDDGAYPGKYKVIVQPAAEGSGGAAATLEEAQRGDPDRAREQRPTLTLPPRYSHPGQTVLVQDVPPDGEVLFELASK